MADDDHRQQMKDVWAAAYDAGEDRWSHAETARGTSTTVLSSLTVPARMLDVGTGRGIDVVRYAAAGHNVTGIDLVALPEWPTIESAWQNASFEQCGLLDHSPAEPYDVIVDAGCCHHQRPDDLADYLAALRALLRPAGVLWLATLRPRTPENPWAPAVAKPRPDGSHTLAFDERSITRILRESGLEVLATTVLIRERSNGLDDLLVRAGVPEKVRHG